MRSLAIPINIGNISFVKFTYSWSIGLWILGRIWRHTSSFYLLVCSLEAACSGIYLKKYLPDNQHRCITTQDCEIDSQCLTDILLTVFDHWDFLSSAFTWSLVWNTENSWSTFVFIDVGNHTIFIPDFDHTSAARGWKFLFNSDNFNLYRHSIQSTLIKKLTEKGKKWEEFHFEKFWSSACEVMLIYSLKNEALKISENYFTNNQTVLISLGNDPKLSNPIFLENDWFSKKVWNYLFIGFTISWNDSILILYMILIQA